MFQGFLDKIVARAGEFLAERRRQQDPRWREACRRLQTAQSITLLTGAGISAESGIPTFRGGKGAVKWRGYTNPAEFSHLEALDIDLKTVWEWYQYRRGIIRAAEPNSAHLAITDLQRRFPDLKVVTQNVDGLHQRAGTTEVIELHGNIWLARCRACGEEDSHWGLSLDSLPPKCASCGGDMRPGVVMFGEQLPRLQWDKAEAAATSNVLIVVGTSALVYPAASLISKAKAAGAFVVEVNPGQTPASGVASLSIRGKASDVVPALLAAACKSGK